MEPIRADEINEIIRKQIENFQSGVTVMEVGTVIKVGDGIAEIHGLEKVMAGADAETADRIMSAYASLGARIVPLAINALKDQANRRGSTSGIGACVAEQPPQSSASRVSFQKLAATRS